MRPTKPHEVAGFNIVEKTLTSDTEMKTAAMTIKHKPANVRAILPAKCFIFSFSLRSRSSRTLVNENRVIVCMTPP